MNFDEAQKYVDAIPDAVAIEGNDRVRTKTTVYHLNRYWLGDVPSVCNLNPDREITDVFIDGRTIYGSWAIMHPETHANVGCGLGEGKGQMYRKVLDRWFKVTAT